MSDKCDMHFRSTIYGNIRDAHETMNRFAAKLWNDTYIQDLVKAGKITAQDYSEFLAYNYGLFEGRTIETRTKGGD